MDKFIKDMENHTDCWPWYWLSYGEKCYAFAVVEAFPVKEYDPFPTPGSKLEMDIDGNWVAEDHIEMIINSKIAEIEQQNGDTICKFIAAAHAHLMNGKLSLES